MAYIVKQDILPYLPERLVDGSATDGAEDLLTAICDAASRETDAMISDLTTTPLALPLDASVRANVITVTVQNAIRIFNERRGVAREAHNEVSTRLTFDAMVERLRAAVSVSRAQTVTDETLLFAAVTA